MDVNWSDVVNYFQNALYEKTYGKSLANSTPASSVVLENPSLVMSRKPKVVESVVPKVPVTPAKSPAKSPAPSVTTTPTKPVNNKQIETRTSDGRRRITPVFIPAEVDSGLVHTVPNCNCKFMDVRLLLTNTFNSGVVYNKMCF